MAKIKSGTQNYPRIQDEKSRFYDCLDETQLNPHVRKIPAGEMKNIIVLAIRTANRKSSRSILKIPEGAPKKETEKILKKKGKSLFDYFLRYYSDPASAAHACLNRHYSEVGKEQFRNKLLQKQRMNSGWRYQYIAKAAANDCGRFISVSDINSQEADFNTVIGMSGQTESLNMYVSVKNRTNTMGGQDWPKAIQALEGVAKNDKNRSGAYLCIFGMAMEKGERNIKRDQKTGRPHSGNTEIWRSDFFWPFFTNFSYKEIVMAVLDVLIDGFSQDESDVEIPSDVLNAFGDCCRKHGLLDKNGHFFDARKLAELFCDGKIQGKGGKK